MSAVIPPLSVQATWPKPNYINPESRKVLALSINLPLIAVTIIVVVMRIVSRAYLTKVGLDDWLMVFAALCAIALMAVTAVATHYGWGRHAWDFEMQWIATAQKIALTTELLFVYTASLTKLSILTFYHRVFSSYRSFKILIYIGFVYCIAYTIGCTVAALTQCRPLSAFWDITVHGVCSSLYVSIMVTSVLNSISDIYMFIIPIPFVWSLHLPTRQRLGLAFAFGLGIIVCAAGLVRLHYIKVTLHDSWDVTWNGVPLYISTAIECNVGIVCASIPALKPLFAYFFPKFSHTTRSGSRHLSSSGAGRDVLTIGSSRRQSKPLPSPSFNTSSRDRVTWKIEEDLFEDEYENLKESNQSIHLSPVVAQGISKKVDIQVTYVTRDDVDDDEEAIWGVARKEAGSIQ